MVAAALHHRLLAHVKMNCWFTAGLAEDLGGWFKHTHRLRLSLQCDLDI